MLKTYTAEQIAEYFLAKTDASVGDLISNLKLQKLCYYAQGIAVAVRRAPLFNESMEAWLHGPVVPAVYRRYKEFGSDAIPPVDVLNIEDYAPADRHILDDVYSYYGQYSAWRLREMTHAEPPWRTNWDEGGGCVISNDDLLQYFSTQVSDGYRQKYEQISKGGIEAVTV